MPEPTCATCGHALTSFCPRCRGQAGGVVKSPKKARAGRKNAKTARRAKAMTTCPAMNTCPQCRRVAPCQAVHLGAGRHRHIACSLACARLREAARTAKARTG